MQTTQSQHFLHCYRVTLITLNNFFYPSIVDLILLCFFEVKRRQDFKILSLVSLKTLLIQHAF